MIAQPRSTSRKESSTRRRWIAFIVGLFLAQAALWTTAISIVADDPSHAVIENYDQRALAWDEQVRRRQRSAALGWSATIDVEALDDTDGPGLVRVHLVDAQARPVRNAQVRLTLFHQARAAERTSMTLKPDSSGTYVGPADLGGSGKWRFELVARRGNDEFSSDQVKTLQPRETP